MRFEWDESKNVGNVRKHGVDFELAREVFVDALAVTRLDRFVDGEERWTIVGAVAGAMLLVAFTIRDEGDEEIVRIISARKATRQERRDFERGS